MTAVVIRHRQMHMADRQTAGDAPCAALFLLAATCLAVLRSASKNQRNPNLLRVATRQELGSSTRPQCFSVEVQRKPAKCCEVVGVTYHACPVMPNKESGHTDSVHLVSRSSCQPASRMVES